MINLARFTGIRFPILKKSTKAVVKLIGKTSIGTSVEYFSLHIRHRAFQASKVAVFKLSKRIIMIKHKIQKVFNFL